MTKVRLVQLVDANDVNPDGTLDYTAPFDRPYDWTVSGDPRLLARTFAFFATDEGLREIRTYADGIGPWKRYIVPTKAIALNPDGTTADANGDGAVTEADLSAPAADGPDPARPRPGLLVHTWTFRNEQRRLPSDYAGNPVNEYLQLYGLGDRRGLLRLYRHRRVRAEPVRLGRGVAEQPLDQHAVLPATVEAAMAALDAHLVEPRGEVGGAARRVVGEHAAGELVEPGALGLVAQGLEQRRPPPRPRAARAT